MAEVQLGPLLMYSRFAPCEQSAKTIILKSVNKLLAFCCYALVQISGNKQQIYCRRGGSSSYLCGKMVTRMQQRINASCGLPVSNTHQFMVALFALRAKRANRT